MYAVERLGSYITRGVYTVSGSFHPFGGAVDIIVVEQPDGSFKSSPWYVRFGKFQGVLKAREKVVTISVNGIETNFHMILDQRGEAYFLRELEGEEGESICFSSSSSDEMEDQSQKSRRPMKSKSCDYDGSNNSSEQIDAGNPKIAARAISDQSRISGLIFGRRSTEDDGFVKAGDGTDLVRITSLEHAEIAADLVETFMLDENDVEEKLVEISEISKNIEGSSPQVADQDVDAEDVIPEASCSDSQFVDMFEGCHQKKLIKQVSNEMDVQLPGFSASEENGSHRVQSHRYCETSESSTMRLDILEEPSEETLYIASGGPQKIHICDRTLHVMPELQVEDTVNWQAEDIGSERRYIESHNMYSQNKVQSSLINGHIETNLEVPVHVSPFTQMVSVDPVINSVEIDSTAISSMSGFSNSINRIRDEARIGNKITRNELEGPLETLGDSGELNEDHHLSVSESSEEEQFFFSDIEDSEPRESQGESGFPDAMDRGDHSSFCPEGINIDNEALPINNESYNSRCNNIQKNRSGDFKKLTENSKCTSSPIYIPKGHSVASAEAERLAESLPNLWSNINNLDKEDLPSLSHSLDSSFRSLEWTMQHRNESHFTSSETGNGNLLVQGHSKDEDTLPLEDMKDGVSNLAVEISLCKHLLHEGMGAQAASQAFDAEKLDLAKFTSMGPSVLKNDRLAVRIKGRYFPWDAAAPIVLGMATFGNENIFEPEGMIPVDRVEKSLVGDPSETIVTTSGSWRLWPFLFRRSRSRKTTPPALHNTRSSDSENFSEGNTGVDTNKNVLNGKVSKNSVKAVTPTSEELASLNLKEGSNEVTFTFSTSVLGKQKVDARIYLWKWNTRIVISDVDGTITKSDVLGQFMPLVGIDWSQTGVAHLFSAIKDNGYQFLYLSARAIAQAYITRQFLVNLKQDGKALPDGPVVISPDGLFPSLFREVIRRAPHEFKIACLEDIRALFPPDCNPFYAGFGNRDTDEISYLKVGIPKGKIFIINPKGEVAVNRLVDTRSYTSLHALVHGMFPAMSSSEQEDYNSWNFWKLPPPDIDL